MIEMKNKIPTFRKQFQGNKMNFETSTEWTLEHILNSYKEEVDFPMVIELAKLPMIIPVTNAWPERGARAVKRIKNITRSAMKNDLS